MAARMPQHKHDARMPQQRRRDQPQNSRTPRPAGDRDLSRAAPRPGRESARPRAGRSRTRALLHGRCPGPERRQQGHRGPRGSLRHDESRDERMGPPVTAQPNAKPQCGLPHADGRERPRNFRRLSGPRSARRAIFVVSVPERGATRMADAIGISRSRGSS